MFKSRLALVLPAIGVLLTSFAFFAPASASAQAVPVASKSSDVSVFGGYSSVTPDFVPGRVNAVTFGVNITRYFRSRIEPSLEGRVNLASGPLVNERSYAFGLRAQTDVKTHFHPYVDFLAGIGDIHYNFATTGYRGDNTTIYSYGGGVDVDLYKHFLLKVDYQGQHWNLGHNVEFQPTVLLVGVAYRIPFRKHNRQQDLVRP